MSRSRFWLPDGTLPPLAGADLSTDETSPTATDVQPPAGQGAPTAESEVQPAAGQGQEDSTTGLYDLSSIDDPTVRSHVERIAKDIDRNVQAKFTEAADFRKEWQPYEELGLRDLGTDSVRALVELAQVLADEETAPDAVRALAEQIGLDLGTPAPDDEGEPDPLADIRAQLDELKEDRETRQHAEATQSELERLQSEWTEVETTAGRKFTEEESTLLMTLAERFDSDPEPIKAAYALFNQIAGHAEKELVTTKGREPRAAEKGGAASTQVDAPQTFEEANKAFKERRAHLHAA